MKIEATAFRIRRQIAAVAILLLGYAQLADAVPKAELVEFKALDGAGINGLWYEPPTPGKVAVILIPQGTGGYTDADHNYSAVAERLNSAGYPFLLANMRTAGRSGWAWERFESSEPDVGGTIAFVKSHGYQSVILLGVSAGGPRSMYYWSRTKDPAIKGIAFMGSITSPYEEAKERTTKQQQADFDSFLAKARAMVKEGRGGEVLCYNRFGKNIGECKPGKGGTLSAESYISYFGTPEESNCSTVKFTPDLTIPAAVIHSKQDPMAMPVVAEKIYASLTHSPKREMIWVENVGHYLEGADADVYAKAFVSWVRRTAPAK